jgi:hypothetical protein
MRKVTNPFFALLVVSVCTLEALTALSCAPHGGRQFLEGRTGIDVAEHPVCGAGVADFERCRPRDTGGVPWEQAVNFPAYSLPHRIARSGGVDRIMSEVRAHYLGSPFYAGDVHAICKDGVDEQIFPEGSTELQDYDLAEVIDDRVIKPVANRMRTLLVERESPDASVISRRFENHLLAEVHDRVQARVLWFVTRYPGGIADLSRERQLRKCLQESRDRQAQVVTGVAGYMVMDNRIDSAVGSREIVNRAFELALRNRGDEVHIEPEFRHALGTEWQQRMADVVHIKMPRNDMTATAWPLWVQFQ